MKRVWAIVLGAGLFLPLIATPATCSNNAQLKTAFVTAFVNPECALKYGWLTN